MWISVAAYFVLLAILAYLWWRLRIRNGPST
jgi:hypothetical protein